MIRSSILTISLLLALALHSGAQQNYQFSLQQAFDFALQNNAQAVNAAIDIDIARKRVWESTATGLPQVQASLGYQDMLKLPVSLIPAEFFGGTPGTFQEISFGTQHNASADISISQLVFNGPYLVGLQAAKAYQSMQEQNYRKTALEVKSGVAQAYYFALLSADLEKTMVGSLTNLRQTYEETSKMYSAGFAQETDVDQLKIALSNLENTQASLERQYKAALGLLKLQLGLPQTAELILSDSLNGILRGFNVETLLSTSFNKEDNIDYQLVETGKELSYLQYQLERSAYLPTLAAFYTYKESAMRNEFNFFDGDEDWYPSSILGVSLSIPITTSGMRNAKVQQAKLALEKTTNSAEFVGNSVEMEATQARFDLSNAYSKYLLQSESIGLATRILERTTIKYKQGLASSMEVTQASNQLLEAQGNYTSAMVEMLNAKLRLDKVMNKL
jgi:outer membrane protein